MNYAQPTFEIKRIKKAYRVSAARFPWRGQQKAKQALAGVSLTLGPGLYGLLQRRESISSASRGCESGLIQFAPTGEGQCDSPRC